MRAADVTIVEVGPVDGLQGLAGTMPTEAKIAWITREAASGVRCIEVTSFVPPKLLPQFVDAETVLSATNGLPGLAVRVLVPNLKGVMRAVAAGATSLSYAFSVSEAHSMSNLRKTREAQMDDFRQIMDFCRTIDPTRRPIVSVGISTCFGCSIQGDVPERDVVEYAVKFAEGGIDEISLADTVGYATPQQVGRLVRRVREAVGSHLKGIHLHDTRGLGLANVVAAVDEGIREIDASLGGLGGCPFAPGATGNIVLEDLAFMLESMGLRTGINFDELLEVRKQVVAALPNAEFHGTIAKAGLPKTFKPAA